MGSRFNAAQIAANSRMQRIFADRAGGRFDGRSTLSLESWYKVPQSLWAIGQQTPLILRGRFEVVDAGGLELL